MSKVSKNKKQFQFAVACVAATVFTMALSLCTTTIINVQVVEAASSFDQNDCMNGYIAKGINVVGEDVLAIKNMCSDCGGGGTGPYGVLWFNDSMTDPRGNVVRIDSWDAETKQVYLWGGVYSCKGSSGVDNWAHFVWFGLPNQMKGNGTTIDKMEGAADFFDLTQSYYGDSVYRGVFRGRVANSKYTWSTFDVRPTTSVSNSYLLPNNATFYPKKFREAALAMNNDQGKCETITEGGVEKLKCSMKISVNRCYSAGSPAKYYNANGARGQRCYGDPSELVLIAPPYNDGGFSSKSKVSADSGTNESLNWDQNAETLEVEADASGNATVKFSHKLRYAAESPSGNYNDAVTSWAISIDDNSGGPWTGTYSTPGGTTAESNWLPETGEISTTVTLGSGEDEKTVCSTISYTPKTVQWDNNDPRNMIPNADPNNNGSTRACAKITRSKTEAAGQIEFWSQSRVESVAAKDVKSHFAETIKKTTGDIATLRLSTDWPSAQANFSHKISYEMTGMTINANDTVDYTNMCTTWTIESGTSANGNSATFCASNYYTGESTVSTTSGHTINISSPGGEASAQEKIKYEKKVVPILREEIKYSCPTLSNPNKKCSYDPKRWKYYAEANTGSGQGNSTAKIIYDRPNEPTGDGPSSGNSGVDGSPMYAGETTSMSWEAQAVPKNTRRVMEFQSISFLSQVSKSLSSANTKGTYQNTIPSGNSYPYREGYNQDPCTFWIYRLGPLRADAGGCAQVTSNPSLNKTFPNGTVSSSEASVGAGETLAVPDWVGDKYCNSFGYKWEYYYGVMNTKGPNAGNWTWTSDNQPYWVHYNATCRTIAKKPSVALWNGGLFVGQGNVKTSTSPRYNNPSVATAASAASDLRRFGSWAEYLANVHGSVGGSIPGVIPGLGGSTGLFSSAAAFAWDGSVESEPIKNSLLTIQNDNANMLGYSGVDANSAMLDRLEAYFKTAATSSDSSIGNITVPAGASNIYYVDGSVNITGPITIASSADSVYQIPQVVIFATDDINISPDVERIDAWLISKNGKVDTCATTNLVDNVTQANVNKSHNPDTRPLRCEKKLVINGPVFAKTVTTDRTFGSDGTANNDEDSNNATNPRAVPAEVFNLSAENYLWAYAQAGRYSSSYTEAYSRELPPRY